jgi:hypothetical protein
VDDHTPLPERAAEIKAEWEGAGAVFDTFCVADEPTGGAPVRCRSLIGVLSADGATGEWFVLDRWGV